MKKIEKLKREVEIREFIYNAVDKMLCARVNGERNKEIAQASLDVVESEYKIAKERYENAMVDKELDDMCDNLIKAIKDYKKLFNN